MTTTKINPGALVFAMVFPSVVTLTFFVLLAGSQTALQQVAYLIGKTIQFGFPAFCVFVVLREKFAWSKPNLKGAGMGLSFGFGLAVATGMLGLYHLWLKPSGFFDEPAEAIAAKIEGFGLSSPLRFAMLGVFYSLGHSLFEEYYWRWFVFRKLRDHLSLNWSIVISSLGFMAHHVIVLGIYFGWESPATYIFSLGVAVGGAMWAWIYTRTGSIYGPWLSHCLVDAGIFILGFDAARGLLEG